MRRSVSVVVPVKDGARFLGELLEAVLAQRDATASLEVLVVDSGSTDGSVEIARAAGVAVAQIPPHEFGHGRTRNFAASRTSGELLCFLTQDATPLPGWLASYQEAFDMDPEVGAAYGPHVARPETSPMIARELEQFFATHAPDGTPVIQRAGGMTFLSNVNACYRRDCWEAIGFPDVRYSEDQAFGATMLERGWVKVYHPGAAVLHAHDYPFTRFMGRYFDEYRGLREAIGHVEGFGVRSSAKVSARAAREDLRWMRARGATLRELAGWAPRAAAHHGGRRVFSALGSRSHGLPGAVQRRLSLEGTVAVRDPGPLAADRPGPPPTRPVAAKGPPIYQEMLELARDGVAPLLPPTPVAWTKERLHVAVVIPPFRRGSGGHNSIFQMVSRLERQGHTVSIWLHDPLGWQRSEWPAVVRRNITQYFAPFSGPVFKGFDDWFGADVAVATGWQTAHRVLRLPLCRARAYLVHDHESQFYATSAESYWAEQTYSLGMHHITANPWLSDIVRRRHGGTASEFDFGVDHDIYRPRPVTRRRDTVVFYARHVTPRRAVPLGLLALEELRRRRPGTRIVLFGDLDPIDAPFDYEHLGIASPEQLAWLYSEATVGLCLSMTNYSLIPQEMLACGLPCVDLAGFSAETIFGADGPVELAAFDPVELADAMERLLEDEGLWERRSASGKAFVAERTWDRAAEQLDAGLREALRLRETGAPGLDVEQGVATTAGKDLSARAVPVAGIETAEATDRLIAHLSPDDVAAVEAALDEPSRAILATAPDIPRRRLTLAFGVWHRVPAVLDKTGLRPDEPPEHIHAMARGPLSAGGSTYDADMVAQAVTSAGVRMDDVRRGLDFGSSSGRALRALAAAWPDIEWHGVDPNADAIAWAAEHVPGARFAASPTDPPLPFADAAFDMAYAISIWSHFGETAAVEWLREMWRLIRPGGVLVMTVHGYRAVEHAAELGMRPPRQLEQIRRALYRRGFWFAPEFGEAGDWGVKHVEWGTAFMTPEWLLRHVSGDWLVASWAVGRNSGNQDVVALIRR